MVTTSDFKRGIVIQIDGAPCLIIDVTFQSPTARGSNTMVKTRYRNLITGQVLDKTFRSGDRSKRRTSNGTKDNSYTPTAKKGSSWT